VPGGNLGESIGTLLNAHFGTRTPTQLGRRVGVGSRGNSKDRAPQPDEIVVAGNLLAPVLVPRRTLLVDANMAGGVSLI
jgi:hypothetical protein